jgi:hypothetical protein
MSGTHGDLFREIGRLVVAAHAGQTIDLTNKSEEMAERYRNLGLPAETLAKAIARSLSAVSVSMEIVPAQLRTNGSTGIAMPHDAISLDDAAPAAKLEPRKLADGPAKRMSRLFPSGIRLGLLS